jgi:hypothetical protein
MGSLTPTISQRRQPILIEFLLGLSQLVRTVVQQLQSGAPGDAQRTERYDYSVGRQGLSV